MADHDIYAELHSAWRSLAPYLPMSLHLIVSALAPIYTGAYASLSRPSSAAAPPPRRERKRRKRTDGEGDSSDEDEDTSDEEEEQVMKMEGLSPSDAVLFPLFAGCTLAGLYLLIKYMGPQLLNRILGVYFSFMACFSVGKLVADGVRVVEGFVWPAVYVDRGRLWMVKQAGRSVVEVGSVRGKTGEGLKRRQPLPGRLGRLELGPRMSAALWSVRGLLGREYLVRLRLQGASVVKAKLTLRAMLASLVGVAVVLYANLVSTPWYLTNLQGFAFSYSALQLLSPTTFGTGSLILVALFFYDIYFVFYTPLMVSVATNLDVPIKMLFPRPEVGEKKPSLAMLGLGDIVLPGIMIGLSLRFDLYLHYLKKQIGSEHTRPKSSGDKDALKMPYIPVTTKWGEKLWTLGWSNKTPLDLPLTKEERRLEGKGQSHTGQRTISSILPAFKTTYFNASITGYVLGMCTTLTIMHVFKHAQPALLYLVPGVLGSVWLTAAIRGEVAEMWAYTENIEEESDESMEKTKDAGEVEKAKQQTEDGPSPKSSWLSDFFGSSFFGQAKMDRNEKRLNDALAKKVQTGDESDAEPSKNERSAAGSTDSPAKKNKASFISFTIQPVMLKQKRSVKAAAATPKGKSSGKTSKVRRSVSGSSSEEPVLVSKEDALEGKAASASGNADASKSATRRSQRTRKA